MDIKEGSLAAKHPLHAGEAIEAPRASWRPLYFPSERHSLFGWLREPARMNASRQGLVICKPMGHESIAGHRTMRALAEMAGELGMPALCFDYADTGNSEDLDAGANRLDVWRKDVHAAVRVLRERTGVAAVHVLGLRLGALVAALAAADDPHVAGVIAISPIVSGRRYLRELRVARLAADGYAAAAPATSPVAVSSQRPVVEIDLEAGGAALSPATVAALGKIDLTTTGIGAANSALIIDRTDLPAAKSWNERLVQQGVRTKYVQLQGFVEIMGRETHHASVPRPVVEAVREWLAELVKRTDVHSQEPASVKDPCDAAVDSPVLRFVQGDSQPSVVTERPVLFGGADKLFGIVSEPRPGELRRRGVILVNSGADLHIGPSRLYVSLARRWAARGYVVLRMDFAGIGDSGPREGHPVDDVFPPEAMDDIRSAIQLLRDRYQVREVTLGGLCSAGYHAIQAAASGLPVDRIVLVNTQTYMWLAGMTVDDLRRLAAGEIKLWRFVRLYGRRACTGALEFALRRMPRWLRVHVGENLGAKLERIAARGISIVFVFARGDPGDPLLRSLAGPSLARIEDHCRIHMIDGANHTFSRNAVRTQLEELLSHELYRGPGAAAMKSGLVTGR